MACRFNHNLTIQQFWWKGKLIKFQTDEMGSWWNHNLTTQQVDEIIIVEMASCLNDKLFQLQVVEIASWWIS